MGDLKEIEYYDNSMEWTKKHPDYDGPGWYFWNEVWADMYGPYETEALAKIKQGEYLKWLDSI